MRKATIQRKTTETEVSAAINLDGKGEGRIDTSVPFLDHMLNLFARHGLLDLVIRSQGDIRIDDHHLVEDVGICLGQAVRKALGDRKGISRYGIGVGSDGREPLQCGDGSLGKTLSDLARRAWGRQDRGIRSRPP